MRFGYNLDMSQPSTTSGSVGKVYLVGAGPGDPGLITVRGMQLLQQADVVVYDYLAAPALLNHCPQARKVYVGKKAAEHTLTQEGINQLLVDLGKQGHKVVRLKGGDPFIFGRGGEECLALKAAGVPFEVVPGITSAIGAAAYAGIPATHRDANSSFTVITGHEKEENYQDPQAKARAGEAGEASDLDFAALARLPGIAFYMGVKALPRICSKLIEHGMSPDMPAASIRWGTTSQQQTVVGTISTLPQRVVEAGLKPPAITIIGKMVNLREAMNWFENRPMFGQTFLVTRTRQQASELSQKLMELGARVIEAPTIELRPPADASEIDRTIREAGGFDWLIFTSANGVTFARKRLDELGLDARVFAKARVAAIGDATAEAIRQQLCLKVDCCPERFVAEALADELTKSGQVSGKRFLMLRADIARPVLRDKLQAAGAKEVRDIAIYETVLPESLPEEALVALRNREVNWVTFTSSSTARNLMTLLGGEVGELMKGLKIASIGPITTGTLRELGYEPTIQAERFDMAHLVEAIAALAGRS